MRWTEHCRLFRAELPAEPVSAAVLTCAPQNHGCFSRAQLPRGRLLSVGCPNAPVKLLPGARTHGDFQGPGEADGGRAAPAVGRESDDVVLMDGALSLRQQQALHLRVLEGAPRKEGRKVSVPLAEGAGSW